jgi:hypothetical protein
MIEVDDEKDLMLSVLRGTTQKFEAVKVMTTS